LGWYGHYPTGASEEQAMLMRRRAFGAVLIEEGMLLGLIAVGAIAGLAALSGGFTIFANNTQNGGNGASGMATSNVPGPTMPDTTELYADNGGAGNPNQYDNQFANAPSGDGLYSWSEADYNAYTFGANGASDNPDNQNSTGWGG